MSGQVNHGFQPDPRKSQVGKCFICGLEKKRHPLMANYEKKLKSSRLETRIHTLELRLITQDEFRAVMNWFMATSPFPAHVPEKVIETWLNREAQARGYKDWLEAYWKL